jgi:hypothetical protein
MRISEVAVTPGIVLERYEDSPLWRKKRRRGVIGETPYKHPTVIGCNETGRCTTQGRIALHHGGRAIPSLQLVEVAEKPNDDATCWRMDPNVMTMERLRTT